MYIWIGCRLPEAFEHELRYGLREMNVQLGLSEVAFTLPQHISLKISFCVAEGQVQSVIDAIAGMLQKEKPFAVRLGGVEVMGNVLWLNIRNNARLKALHAQLDAMLQKEFGVEPHLFDRDFRFHSTLFLDDNVEKLKAAHDILSQYPNDETLGIAQFLIGTSETGERGTYRVVREISV